MANPPYHRFAITMPERMAKEIDSICEAEGRNRSEFFREAVRVYLAARLRDPQFPTTAGTKEHKD